MSRHTPMNEAPEFVLSPVKRRVVDQSPLEPIYARDEKIPVVTISNFPALGRLVAMRFIEWVQENPDIVTCALDPEASGPDTHYKVLQAISEATKGRPINNFPVSEKGLD